MEIKEVDKADLQEILELQKKAFYSVALFYNNFSLSPLNTSIEELEENFYKYKYFKAIEDNLIIGSIRAITISNKCKIENVIVHPEYQKNGIGTKLLQHIENTYYQSNCFELKTGLNTPGNVDFYMKNGYEIIDTIPKTASEPELVLMRKQGTSSNIE